MASSGAPSTGGLLRAPKRPRLSRTFAVDLLPRPVRVLRFVVGGSDAVPTELAVDLTVVVFGCDF